MGPSAPAAETYSLQIVGSVGGSKADALPVWHCVGAVVRVVFRSAASFTQSHPVDRASEIARYSELGSFPPVDGRGGTLIRPSGTFSLHPLRY